MKRFKAYGQGLLHLFFPKTCLVCAHPLLQREKEICYRCIAELEPARYTDFRRNEIVHLLEGNIPVAFATAGFRYHKGGILQQLIFLLKYHYHKEIGEILGREMGYALENTPFTAVDYVIPVPLHPRKQRARGYNQSEWIARGVAGALKKELCTGVLKRNLDMVSQTKKSRMQRFENMKDVFSLSVRGILGGKHILLVDDVVTTGSTLISCAEALMKSNENIQISVACLAKADA